MLPDLRFDLVDPLQGLVPASFKLVGDQSILRVGRVVLLLRSSSTVRRRLQVALERRQDFVDLACLLFVGDDRRLDCGWLHDAQDLPRHRLAHHILGDSRLQALELLPADVAVVCALNERKPLFPRFAAHPLTGLAAIVLGQLFGLAI